MSNKLQFIWQVSGAAAKGPLVQRGLSKVAVVPLLTGGLSFFLQSLRPKSKILATSSPR